jgi:hypothetical protein
MSYPLLALTLVGIGGWVLLLAGRRDFGSWFQLLVEALAVETVVAPLAAVALVSFGVFRTAYALELAAALPWGVSAADRRSLPRWASGAPLTSPRDRFVLLLLAVLAPIVLPRLQPLRMDHDAGVYSTRAIYHLRKGGLRGEIPVRGRLHGDLLKIFDRDNMQWTAPEGETRGDRAGGYLPGTYVSSSDPDRFQFQFFPGWPMVMALWAGVFGLQNVFHALTFLYALGVALFGLLVERYAHGWAAQATSLVLFASSPLVIFFSKYTTSEMLLLFLFLFVLHLFGRSSSLHAVLAGAVLLLLVVSHSSTFLYAPLLLLVLLTAYRLGNRWLAVSSALAFAALLVSLPLGSFFSPFYLRDVYSISFAFLPVADPTAVGFALVAAFYTVGFGLSLALLRPVPGLSARQAVWAAEAERLLPAVIPPALVLMAAWTAWRGYQLGWTDRFTHGAGTWALRAQYAGQGWPSVAHLDIVSMVMATSIVGLPVVVAVAALRARETCESQRHGFLLGAVLWTLAVYTFFRVDTPINYYGSRYFLPVLVPTTMLLLAGVLGRPRRAKAAALITLVGLAFSLPFDVAFCRAPPDDYKLRFVQEVAARVGSNGTLFLRADEPTFRLLALSLQCLNGITVVRVAHLRGLPELDLIERYATRLGLSHAAVLSALEPHDQAFRILWVEDNDFAQRGILYPTETYGRRRPYYLYDAIFAPDRGAAAEGSQSGPADRDKIH